MAYPLTPVIGILEDKCVNCHACISVCPVKYCNDSSGDVVRINSNMCIGCGSCLKACTHKARIPLDDFDAFLADLRSGVRMVAIVAPAIAANFPNRYLNLNGWLHSMGVAAFFDVSFGAELTVQSYLHHLKTNSPKCIIAQPCPAIVSYIEIYQPELLPYLAPADSPMLHTMKMVREYYPDYQGYKFVVISPCVAKKREFEATGMGDYNITYASIEKFLKEKEIFLNSFVERDYDNPPAERAVLFSTPGGLLRTAMRESPGIFENARKIEGSEIVYDYLKTLKHSIDLGQNPLLIDCLNCAMGCNGGTGTSSGEKSMDEVEFLIEQRSIEMQKRYVAKKSILSKFQTNQLTKVIQDNWKPNLYHRSYVNRESNIDVHNIPSERIQEIFKKELNKASKKEELNCHSCGYKSCEAMATAIHFNKSSPEHCFLYKQKQSEYYAKKSNDELNIVKNVHGTYTHLGEQSTQNMASVAAATEEMSATIQDISASTCRARMTTEKAAQQIDQFKNVMLSLSKVAQEIGKVTETITSISAQTNLLALNATIEAARAGASGKGFAVVANEIKNLAQQTAGATSDIKSRISSIQEVTGAAATDVYKIVEVIQEVNSVVTSIAAAVEEQSVVTKDVAEHITRTSHDIKKAHENVATLVLNLSSSESANSAGIKV